MRIEEIGPATLINGDCREVMAAMEENSVDAIVCDPPYGIGFMGKGWDHGIPGPEFWVEALRVAKPGAHLLAFGGTRMHHRLMVAIEDAGWEIRDVLMWMYGQGMGKGKKIEGGFGTGLKPAWEPIILARKPLDGTVTENFAKWGTGVLNIDACRVLRGTGDRTEYRLKTARRSAGTCYSAPSPNADFDSSNGRHPANLLHDGSDEVLSYFPDSDGSGASLPNVKITGYGDGIGTGESRYLGGPRTPVNCGSGSAARFFWCPKASKRDRNEGMDGEPDRVLARSDQAQAEATRGNIIVEGGGAFNKARVTKNNHATVKPTALMRYLCRLVTPPGGLVLDPFMGSGSTGKAALLEGFRFVGTDSDEEHGYFDIACARIRHAIMEK